MRVLLVEDDRMIATAVTQALVDAAYAVDWVEDGDKAITAIKLHAYDFVLLDLGSSSSLIPKDASFCGSGPVCVSQRHRPLMR